MILDILKGISKTIYENIIQPKRKDIRIYVENLFKLPRRPYFLVLNIKMDPLKINNNLWNYNYLMDIIYVPQIVIKPLLSTKNSYQIRTECQEIGDILKRILDPLNLKINNEQNVIHGKDITYQILENILHFSITYSFNVYETQNTVLMNKLNGDYVNENQQRVIHLTVGNNRK